MDSEKPKFNWQRMLITLGIVLATAAVVGGTTWYIMDKNAKDLQASTDKAAADLAKTTKVIKVDNTFTPPANFSKITVANATLYVPQDWGKGKQTVTETTGGDLIPGSTFKGETVIYGDYDGQVVVTEANAYEAYPALKDKAALLNKIFQDKTVKPETILANSVYLPPVNAAVMPYNPRYVESSNGNWRGVWYLAHIAQGLTSDLSFVALLTDGNGKLILINKKIESAETKKLQAELETTSINDSQAWEWKREKYMESAYATDTEVKAVVDGTLLKVVSSLQ